MAFRKCRYRSWKSAMICYIRDIPRVCQHTLHALKSSYFLKNSKKRGKGERKRGILGGPINATLAHRVSMRGCSRRRLLQHCWGAVPSCSPLSVAEHISTHAGAKEACQPLPATRGTDGLLGRSGLRLYLLQAARLQGPARLTGPHCMASARHVQM